MSQHYSKVNSDQTNWQTFKILWPYIKPFKIGIFVAAIALAINALTDTYLLSLLKPLLDEGFGSADSSFLQKLPWIILVLMLVRGASSFVSTYCLSWVSSNVVMWFRRHLFNHFLKMPVSFFDQETTGSLLSRVTYDSEQVANATSKSLVVIVREGVSIIGLIGLMLWNSWKLTLILFVLAPVVAFAIRVTAKRFRKVSRNIQSAMGLMTVSTEQMLKGHKVILSFGGQKIEKERFENVSNHMRQQQMKLIVAQAAANPVIQIIASFALVIILFLANADWVKDELTAGSFTVIFSSMLTLMRPLRALTNVTSQFQKGMTACQTLFGLMDEPVEKDTGTYETPTVKGDIEVKNLTFTYPTQESPALKNISFHLPAGKTVALVGRSGSGKSTIANLLTRFYDIDSGELLLDGHNICEYSLSNLRQHFAIVTQQVHLFNDTVANNIAYATEEKCSQKDIENAAKLAYAYDFIKALPQGFNTIIGEDGVNLSGGQRQRLAIARALLRDAPILILDEATSALDTESERAIQAALDELQKDRTVLVIAHRLSTIEEADEILVIDDGQVIERGNHQMLMKKQGTYAQLHDIQFGHDEF